VRGQSVPQLPATDSDTGRVAGRSGFARCEAGGGGQAGALKARRQVAGGWSGRRWYGPGATRVAQWQDERRGAGLERIGAGGELRRGCSSRRMGFTQRTAEPDESPAGGWHVGDAALSYRQPWPRHAPLVDGTGQTRALRLVRQEFTGELCSTPPKRGAVRKQRGASRLVILAFGP
jgi:hypothetical protein